MNKLVLFALIPGLVLCKPAEKLIDRGVSSGLSSLSRDVTIIGVTIGTVLALRAGYWYLYRKPQFKEELKALKTDIGSTDAAIMANQRDSERVKQLLRDRNAIYFKKAYLEMALKLPLGIVL